MAPLPGRQVGRQCSRKAAAGGNWRDLALDRLERAADEHLVGCYLRSVDPTWESLRRNRTSSACCGT
jgi:hypothetical protein